MRTSHLFAALVTSAGVLLAPQLARADDCRPRCYPRSQPCVGDDDYPSPDQVPVNIGHGDFEIGLLSRSFANHASQGLGSFVLAGTPYMFSADSGDMDHAQGGFTRASVFIGHFVMGGDLELASLEPADMNVAIDGFGSQPIVTGTGGKMVGGDFMLGLGTKVDGNVFVGVEVLAGLRMIEYSFDARLDGFDTSTTMWAVGPLLEARAHAAVWLSDGVNLNVFAGRGFLDDGKVVGIAIGFVDRGAGA